MDGNDLIKFGFKPGPYFAEMLKVGNSLEYHEVDPDDIRTELQDIYDSANVEVETIPLQDTLDCAVYLDKPDEGFDRDNYDAVIATMNEVVKTPTVVSATIMPDACPAGPLGTIPVGGVVVSKNTIHPGMHSADICCSMFLTSLNVDRPIGDVMDAIQKRSHFGLGGRKDLSLDNDDDLIQRAKDNSFLSTKEMLFAMSDHFGTQGDGNHFFYVGRRELSGDLTFVTHHGSRKPGALLYKYGMKVAERFRSELSPDTLKQNAWIPFDTVEGQDYWEALQIIRDWTKRNHIIVHDSVMDELLISRLEISDRFWNEHNFVFKRNGDEFHHAKGSTPVYGNHAHDADAYGRTLVPLNMGEPILIVKDHDKNRHGFAPHGAGRNMSRTKYMKLNAGKTVDEIMKEQVGHIDARFFTGKPDASELPGAYKKADEVIRQIGKYELANIVDRVMPLGSMMAGHVDQPWRKKK